MVGDAVMTELFTEYVDTDLEVLIPAFLENTREEIAVLGKAIAERDSKLAFRMGHNIKGSAGNYGFLKLAEIGRSIEKAAYKGDLSAVEKLFVLLTDYIGRVEVVYK